MFLNVVTQGQGLVSQQKDKASTRARARAGVWWGLDVCVSSFF